MAKDNTPPSSRAPAAAESIAKPSNDGDVKFGEQLAKLDEKVEHLATKEDLALLSGVMHDKFAETNARIDRAFAETNARIDRALAEANARIEKAFSEANAKTDRAFSEANAKTDGAFAETKVRITRLEAQMAMVLRLLYIITGGIVSGALAMTIVALRLLLGG